MPQLSELIVRRWSEAKAALESSARSGSRPGAGVDVDAILNEMAGLIRSVGREELQELLRHSGSTPRPAGQVILPGALRTAELPSSSDGLLATSDGSSLGDPGFTTDLPLHNAVSSPSALTEASQGTMDTGGGSVALARAVGTGEYTPEGNSVPLLDSKADTKSAEPSQRRVPAIPGYEINGVLGRGGMGVVYRAVQIGLRRTVALKMILAGEHSSAAQLARFSAEARAVAMIRDPGIVQIYEIGEHEGLPYFSLEFCPGGSLDRKLKHEPQPPREAAALAEQLARSMAAAHSAGVIHRDLKPANVLLDADNRPKITDFGLARELDDAEGQTRTGSVLGTPSYMSPEQAMGMKVGPAADQYSLGATLYELLTGRPPFQGASIMETLEQVRKREPVPPTQLQPGCPKDLETICLKALQKETAKRYTNCAELADDLKAFLENRPILARPVGTVEKAWRWAKRNPRVASLGATVAALLVVLAIGGFAAAAIFDTKKREAEQARDDKDAALQAEIRAVVAKDQALTEKTQALAAEEVAHKESEESFVLTRETVFVALDEIPSILSQAVFAKVAEQKVLEALGAMLEKQLGLALTRGLPDRGVMNFHLKMGDVLTRRNKPQEALAHYRKALEITGRLMKTETREKDKAKGNHALVNRRLANLYRDASAQGDGEALRLYGEAITLQRDLMEHPQTGEIPPVESKASLAATLMDVALAHWKKRSFGKGVPPCEEALKLWQEVIKEKPTKYTAGAPQALAETHMLLGKLKFRLGGHDGETEKSLAEGVERHRALLKSNPTDTNEQGLAAKAARDYGDYLLMSGRFKEATPLHEMDVELTRGLLRTPEVMGAQSQLADAYYRSATLALKKGDRLLSDKLYRKCLDLRLAVAEGWEKELLQIIRVANAQARCGLHAEASAAMEKLLVDQQKHVQIAYITRQAAFNIALCVDAVSAGRPDDKLTDAEKKLRDKYADRALTLIEHLVKLKYKDVVELNTDPDLDPIRDRPRFKKVVNDLTPPAKP